MSEMNLFFKKFSGSFRLPKELWTFEVGIFFKHPVHILYINCIYVHRPGGALTERSQIRTAHAERRLKSVTLDQARLDMRM